MSNKSFGVYTIGKETVVEDGDKLILEIGKCHLAAIHTKDNNDFIVGFELFTFKESDAESLDTLFNKLTPDSNFLNSNFSSVHVFINKETCIPVPADKFKKQIATDFLDLVFSEDNNAEIHFDYVETDPALMNVYRIKTDWQGVLTSKFPNVDFTHTWSNVLKTHHSTVTDMPHEFISVQFYNTIFIVTVYSRGKLQLIQSFIYETPEDALYHLLNITKQFGFSKNDLTLQISGLIDLNYKLYRELTNYFHNIALKKVDKAKVLVDLSEHPRHYFTPFFNLTS